VNYAVLRALGAKPFEERNWAAFTTAVEKGNLEGALCDLECVPSGATDRWTATANITQYARATTLVVNSHAFDALSQEQQDVLRRAAADTQRWFVQHNDSEKKAAAKSCAAGVRIVTATRADLEALERLEQPVYAALERDPVTKRLIERIRQLKLET